MLLNFKVKNYLSFKGEAGFSMEANRKIKNRNTVNNKNIIKLKDGETIWLNKTAIFYGANASGKTNIFKGLDFLKYITLNSFGFQPGLGIKDELLEREKRQGVRVFFDSFLLDEDSKQKDIEFEIEFLIDKIKYKYFLKLNQDEILKERLSYFEKSKEKVIINRQITKGEIEETYFGFEDEDFEKLKLFPRDNQTFISLLADKDSKGKFLATKIIKFFRGVNFIDSRFDLTGLTLPMLEIESKKETILNFIKSADINIEDIKQEEREYKEDDGIILMKNGQRFIPNKILELNFVHPVYQNKKRVGNIGFNLEKQESLGTKRLFGLVGIILKTIENNGILLIDEIDTHMHSLIIESLISIIHGINENGKNKIGESQFLFNTHSLDLMDLELFKKDQIYFTSKDFYGATEIYSLDDFKVIQIRNNSDIKKAYKLGAFGAIPILSEFNL
ncbi:MAG: ATP-binding protein [Candidatus Gracilibacteria bacterium]|nr:ATP-binding protein [Candidatus Gracilibacteria bacterium]